MPSTVSFVEALRELLDASVPGPARVDVDAILEGFGGELRGDDDDDALGLLEGLSTRPDVRARAIDLFHPRLDHDVHAERHAARLALGPGGLDANELIPSLLADLAHRRGGADYHVCLVWLLSMFEVDAPAWDAFLAAFVEALLRTGQPQQALRDAGPRLLETGDGVLPTMPLTRRERHLKGTTALDCDPYAYRQLIAAVIDALGERIQARRALVPWLFEAFKLWGSHERGLVVNAFDGVALTTDELRSGLATVADFASDAAGRDAAAGLKTLLELGAQRLDWLLATLETVAARPAAAARLASTVRPWTLGSALGGKHLPCIDQVDAASLPRLEALVRSEQPVVAVLAADLVLRLAPSGAAARRVLVAALGDADLSDPVREIAALTLLAAGTFDAEITAAAREALTHSPGRAADALRAIVRNGAGPPSRAVLGPVHQAGQLRLFPVGGRARSLIATPHGIVAPLQRIVRAVPSKAWLTDQETVGVVLFRGDTPQWLPAPLALPIARTGGVGARRELRAAGLLGDQVIVFVLQTPFSRKKSWGTENRLLGLDLASRCWRCWEGTPRDGLSPRTLDAGRLVSESEIASVCPGDLIAWVDAGDTLRLAVDGTPYHLDDWELSQGTKTALALASDARSRHGWSDLVRRRRTAATRRSVALGGGPRRWRRRGRGDRLRAERLITGRPKLVDSAIRRQASFQPP